MTFDELKEAVSNGDAAYTNAFEVLAEVSALIARARSEEAPEMSQAREIAIRMVEHRDAMGARVAMLDAVLRRLGLFPYLDEDLLGMKDRLAVEAHRPFDLPDEGIVFHRVQADVYRRLMDGENVVLSAPTSFGKSLVIDALVASGKYKNIVVVVPTIALIDETRRRLSRFAPSYKVVTHVSQPLADRNLLVLTQERVLDLPELPPVDLFVVDEFYKLSPDRESEKSRDRTYLLNQAFQRLYRTGAQFYFLGPNIEALAQGIPDDFLGRVQFVRTDVSTVAVDEFRIDGGTEPHAKLAELCLGLDEPTLIYCQSPRSARLVLDALVSAGVAFPDPSLDRAVEWVGTNYHPDWSVCDGLARGIGVHHGQMPRALAHFMVRAFKERRLRFLICTSTLIEGVNTPAKNVVVFDKKVGKTTFDFFDFSNIRGRSGRMSVHYVGRVFLFHRRPDEVLPDIDIPALSQPADIPSSLLLGLNEDELTDSSRVRLDELMADANLPAEVLRASVGLDAERQFALARMIEANIDELAPLLRWHGLPDLDELRTACDLIWGPLNDGRKEHGAYSSKQLAFQIGRLRDAPEVRELIEEETHNEWRIEKEHTTDQIVQDVLDFRRFWASHTFPRLLMALDRIAKSVLGRNGRETGDFTVFAAQVENFFLPAPVTALEEYGLPQTVSMQLRGLLDPDGDLDATLANLANQRKAPTQLGPFELELLEDLRSSLVGGSG